ncbi:hypothetical protein ABZW18_18190 [Streptomyces sp. NPDC004647]|uniref:hypothetical protein n=1 Tax=Streptomyces sp. NPDC004647 TaxID=3154671 RepID=UPI0033AC4B1E
MPVTLTAPHSSPVTVDDEDVCRDCLGSVVSVDDDGELTGTPGALVPCFCVTGCSCEVCAALGSATACPCRVACWPHNDGYTGWVPLTLDEFEDDSPLFHPCVVHRPVIASAGVMA